MNIQTLLNPSHASYAGTNIGLLRPPFFVPTLLAIYKPNRKISVNSHPDHLWLPLIPKQKSCRTDIFKARFMLKCQLQRDTKHLVIGSAVILEVTALLMLLSACLMWGSERTDLTEDSMLKNFYLNMRFFASQDCNDILRSMLPGQKVFPQFSLLG